MLSVCANPALLGSIILFVVVLCVSLVFVLRRSSIYDPIVIFLGFYALFVLPLPVRLLFTKQIEGDISDNLPVFAPYLPAAVLFCSVAIPLLVIGYYSRLAQYVGERIPCLREGSYRKTFWAAVTVCAFSLFLVERLAADVGSLLQFFLLGYDASSAAMVGKGYLAAGFPWFFVGSSLWLYRYSVYKNRRDLIVFAILLSLQLLVFFVLGDRHSIMNVLMVTLFFWHYAICQVRFSRLLIIAVIGFLGLNLMGQLRQSNYKDLSDLHEKTSKALSRSEGSGLFYTITSGEFVVPIETLPQIMQGMRFSISPAMGWTFLRTPMFFVPSAVFPDRPIPLANWYMQRFYGGGYEMSQGRAWFFLSEGYLNFGPVGVVVLALFWGVLLGAVQRYRSTGNKAAALLSAFFVAFLFRAICGDFSTLLVGLPEQFLGMAVISLYMSQGRLRRELKS